MSVGRSWRTLPKSDQEKFRRLATDEKQRIVTRNEFAAQRALGNHEYDIMPPNFKALRPSEIKMYGTARQYRKYVSYWNEIFKCYKTYKDSIEDGNLEEITEEEFLKQLNSIDKLFGQDVHK